MLCDHLEASEAWEMGRDFRKEGIYVYLWLIYIDVWQMPTQYCKTIILQLKKKIAWLYLNSEFAVTRDDQ